MSASNEDPVIEGALGAADNGSADQLAIKGLQEALEAAAVLT